jgi:tetratricopeptide (TPR) repeat protein
MEFDATSDAPRVELVAMLLRPTSVRCREIGGGDVSYRRTLPRIVPGMRLTVAAERRWTFRQTEMIGGPLLHAGFSLRALDHVGLAHTEWRRDGLGSPGDEDARLALGLAALAEGEWIPARAHLLEVLAAEPGNLQAHAALGELHARIEHRAVAAEHFTAAIRLGLGALAPEESLPLDPLRPTELALLRSLRGRATLLCAEGQHAAAALDLRRALAWDPTDAAGCAPLLSELEVAAPGRPAEAAPAAEGRALAEAP